MLSYNFENSNFPNSFDFVHWDLSPRLNIAIHTFEYFESKYLKMFPPDV